MFPLNLAHAESLNDLPACTLLLMAVCKPEANLAVTAASSWPAAASAGVLAIFSHCRFCLRLLHMSCCSSQPFHILSLSMLALSLQPAATTARRAARARRQPKRRSQQPTAAPAGRRSRRHTRSYRRWVLLIALMSGLGCRRGTRDG